MSDGTDGLRVVLDFEYPSSGQGFAFEGERHGLKFLETESDDFSRGIAQTNEALSKKIEELTSELASLRASLSEKLLESRAEGEKVARLLADQEVQELRSHVERFEACTEQANRLRLAEIESSAVRLSIRIAEKILHHEASLNPLFVAGAVRIGIDRLRQDETAVLRVPSSDVEAWKQFLQRSTKRQVEIQGDAFMRVGDCALDISGGQIDLSISAQLNEISRSFEQILNPHGEAARG